MSDLRQLWTTLTRPRGARRRARWGRKGGSERSGVAILMVIATLMVLVVITSELAYGARVRFMVANHQRERAQAYWVARSGYNLARIILIADREIANQASGNSFIPDEIKGLLGGGMLWNMLGPMLNTGILRMIMGAGGSISDVDKEDLEAYEQSGEVPEEYKADEEDKPSRFSDKSFLDFDGDFMVEITDMESRFNINAFASEQTVGSITESGTGKALFAMMSGPENDQWFYEQNIDRWEVISNLKDWVDPDNVRSGLRGGYEDTLYNRLDPPYLTKNAPFDSLAEITMVDGWQGELYDRYADRFTVFGDPNGKVNYQTADDLVVYAAVSDCMQGAYTPDLWVTTLERLSEQDLLFIPAMLEPKDYVQKLVDAGVPMDANCAAGKLTKESKVFLVKATGIVAQSSVTLTAILDFTNASEGDLVYWRVD